MAVSEADVQALAQALLGRNVAPEFLAQYMDFENPAAVYDAMYNSAEAQNFRKTGVAASLDNPGVLPTGDGTVNTAVQATEADIRSLYTELLGGPPKPEAIEYWLSQGMTPAKLRESIVASPEAQQYADTGRVSDARQAYMDSLAAGNDGGQSSNPANFNPLIQQYYQELFNREARQPGLDYFSGELRSGNIAEDNLRNAIIAGAQGTDKVYYQGSQSGDPVFAATQALFGRRPARGAYNPETGQLEGGYGQYMSRLESGDLTEDQLRRNLVDLAYDRGEGGGRSADYQAYLDSLGINRENQPFLQEGGSYANIGYGADLSEYQQPSQGESPMPGFPGGFPGKGGGGSPRPGGQYTPPSYGGRMPGQYITGNQLYSGLPYGMTQPMGKGGGMGGGFMQPTVYQPPQFSQQYMPNRGLMSGYSTGFGPYGGYQRPMGGKGGMMRPRPRFGYGGKGGY